MNARVDTPLLRLVLLLAALCWSVAASAQSAAVANSAAAQAAFNSGMTAFERGDFEAARKDLGRSEELEPSISTEMKLAQCDEALGNLVAAWVGFNRLLARLPAVHLPDDKRQQFERMARKYEASLKARLAILRLSVEPLAEGLTVTRDGEPVPLGVLGEDLPLNPGNHHVVAAAPRYQSVERDIELVVGQPKDVKLVLMRGALVQGGAVSKQAGGPGQERALSVASAHVAAEGDSSSRPAAIDLTRSNSHRTQKVLGYSLGGAGLAALLVAGAFAVQTLVLVDRASPHCMLPGDTCDSRGVTLRNEARGAQTRGFVLLGAGLASFSIGLVLVLTGSGHDSHAQILPAPNALSIAGRI
jgi:hypothetical protein